MNWLIASDIHGDAACVEKLLGAYRRENAQRMILLGDILYHGPRNDLPPGYDPKAVIAALNELGDEIVSVRGNCDTEVDQMVLAFPVMADYALIPLANRTVFATHGHVWNTQSPPPMKPGDILLGGHTHIPTCENFGDSLTYINPGSVSIPKNGSPKSYMILRDGAFVWKTLEGETYRTYAF